MKHSVFFYVLFALSLAFLFACSDDDSDNFLVRGDTASYSSEEDDELSSSSSRSSSSSEQRSSSSSDAWLDTIPYVSPCRDEEDDNCKYGILADERDGQSYRTVDIGEQTWMAENLNYASESSKCYNDSLEYCDLYGRLYSWADAMEVCPSGWHLPSLDEWKILYTYAGGIYTSASKLRTTSGWMNPDAEGTDDYGFSVLPAGAFRDLHGSGFRDLYESAIFWTSTDYAYSELDVYDICFDKRDKMVDGHSQKTRNLLSVRCLKN
ncbi:fibrobacter succinogenes major paralogous domain-containing protein [Fibrobacter sp.]|uniref:fibrobacter succinogenes major paralogous domain-containing protein n=1 Tax=Fibrobacter sp. TaxID=35828 RepID=UPI0025C3001E|nr:fibrobacter succinogenes major paralogous domain-containing protein [Fibrobacter sp.]MBR2306495.1 fibrobacter succinogenes major paralogous domain-containing protein [Fibrobacter sp.]